jgi:5-carboxymethyl-2-hydroxymuconate isomerase
MPHIILEYSANLADRFDIGGLCDAALDAAAAIPIFDVAAARVRAIRCDHYAIGDRHPDNAFVDVTLKIGAGRSAEQKQAAGQAMFDALRAHCAPLYANGHFALSAEIREIDARLSWKDNGIKARLQGERA